MLAVSAAAGPASRPAMPDRCERLAEAWRGRFEKEKLAWAVSPPFVVAGDGGHARVKGVLERTILPARRALSAKFFKTPPEEPILILLFEGEGTYRRLARDWLGDRDVPHYGYFRRDNVMVMNLATGTGTLVHELVHALIRSDFPVVPSWFNEGMGSLFEQCRFGGENDIRGLTNWRLPALQNAIREGKLRPLEEMIEDPAFYGPNQGLNYAQARYVLLYLQEKGLLEGYYKAFRGSVEDDPTGLITLKKVLNVRKLNDFDAEWRQWVLSLHFP